MRRFTYSMIILVLLCAGTTTAIASEAESKPLEPAFAAMIAAAHPESTAASGPSILTGSCTITIDCADGTTRTCSDNDGTPSCDGSDQVCPGGSGGFVNCDGGAVEARCGVCPCVQGASCTNHSDCGDSFCAPLTGTCQCEM